MLKTKIACAKGVEPNYDVRLFIGYTARVYVKFKSILKIHTVQRTCMTCDEVVYVMW